MSLAVTISNASAGLAANTTLLNTSSQNVAGANVDGYVRRDATSENAIGGVSVSVSRAAIDAYLQRDLRWANAEAASAGVRLSALDSYAAATGATDGDFAPSAALSALEAAFVALEADPANATNQRSALTAARDVAAAMGAASTALASARAEAHGELEAGVDATNDLLTRIDSLNTQIVAAEGLDRDANALRDQRDAAVDQLAQFLPITATERPNGELVISVRGGPTLVDGYARQLAFDAAVTPAGAGPGYPTYPGVRVDDPTAPASATDLSDLTEGRLGGALQARDQDLVDAERQLDALARGVILAFQNADASLAPGDAGLFTESGAAVDPLVASDLGLAGRIAVNDAVDPDAGGALRRLRDGINAPVGAPQDATQVRAFLDAFNATTPFPAAAGLTTSTSIASYAIEVAAAANTARSDIAARSDNRTAVLAGLETQRAAMGGVDLDAEAQHLLELERYYAANAQILSVVGALLDELLAATR